MDVLPNRWKRFFSQLVHTLWKTLSEQMVCEDGRGVRYIESEDLQPSGLLSRKNKRSQGILLSA